MSRNVTITIILAHNIIFPLFLVKKLVIKTELKHVKRCRGRNIQKYLPFGSIGPLTDPVRADLRIEVLRFLNILSSSTWPGWDAAREINTSGSLNSVCQNSNLPTNRFLLIKDVPEFCYAQIY